MARMLNWNDPASPIDRQGAWARTGTQPREPRQDREVGLDRAWQASPSCRPADGNPSPAPMKTNIRYWKSVEREALEEFDAGRTKTALDAAACEFMRARARVLELTAKKAEAGA